MIMKYIKKIHYFLIILIISCNFQNESDDITELYVVLNDNQKNISDYVEKMEVIVLETNDDCLISSVAKIKYINEKLYVFDIRMNSLFVFNKDGSCDTILSKRGGGPGEYIQLIDFDVAENHIQVLEPLGAIKRYDFDLEFIGEDKFNIYSSQFIQKKDTVFLWNESTNSPNEFYITSINLNNNEIHNFLKMPIRSKKNVGAIIGNINTFVLKNEQLYASSKLDNMIYYYSDNNFHPKYRITFDKNNFPQNQDVYEYFEEYYGDNFPYAVKENYYISDKYLVFQYYYANDRYFCFYDLTTGLLSNGKMKHDLVEDFIFFPRWGNDNYLIGAVPAESVMYDFPALSKFNEHIKDMKKDDNPVIILYTLKSK